MGATGRPMHRGPWNKGNLVGQKAPFKLKDLWALRVRLQMEGRVRELALFSLGIDSRLRGCDLGALRVRDVCHGDQLATRAVVMQHETQQPVQLEITQATREVLQAWINQAGLKSEDCLFPRRLHDSPLLGTREYARILGHSKLEWTVRRLGIAVDDALESPNRWKSEALDGGRERHLGGVLREEIRGAAAQSGGHLVPGRIVSLGQEPMVALFCFRASRLVGHEQREGPRTRLTRALNAGAFTSALCSLLRATGTSR